MDNSILIWSAYITFFLGVMFSVLPKFFKLKQKISSTKTYLKTWNIQLEKNIDTMSKGLNKLAKNIKNPAIQSTPLTINNIMYSIALEIKDEIYLSCVHNSKKKNRQQMMNTYFELIHHLKTLEILLKLTKENYINISELRTQLIATFSETSNEFTEIANKIAIEIGQRGRSNPHSLIEHEREYFKQFKEIHNIESNNYPQFILFVSKIEEISQKAINTKFIGDFEKLLKLCQTCKSNHANILDQLAHFEITFSDFSSNMAIIKNKISDNVKLLSESKSSFFPSSI